MDSMKTEKFRKKQELNYDLCPGMGLGSLGGLDTSLGLFGVCVMAQGNSCCKRAHLFYMHGSKNTDCTNFLYICT